MHSLLEHLKKNVLKRTTRWINSPTRIISVILGIALVATLGISFMELYANDNITRVNNRRDAVRNQLNIADSLLTSIQTIDIDQRDYILTNNSAYLEKSQSIYPDLGGYIKELKLRTHVKVVDADTNKLIFLTLGKEKQLNQSIVAYQKSGAAAAVATFSGSEYSTTRIEEVVKDIRSNQKQILNNYQSDLDLYESLLNIASPFVVALDAVIFIITIYIFHWGLEKERKLERAQSEFISIASHQLRTPATTIKQYVSMLRSGLFGSLNRKQKNILNIIEGANSRSISIANNLLYSSLIESGRARVKISPCDLGEIISKAIENYASVIKNNELRLKLSLPKRALFIDSDANYLQIAFEVIIDNACRYSETGKHLTITLKKKHKEYIIRFKDSGIGVKPSDQKKLFKKFSRLEDGIKMYPDGSGVGLYLLKSISKELNFRYSLSSRINRGTMLELYFQK